MTGCLVSLFGLSTRTMEKTSLCQGPKIQFIPIYRAVFGTILVAEKPTKLPDDAITT